MSWKDKLQAASFRGVEFHVETEEGAFGRRNQLHQYPGRDKPYVEDNGRAAREVSITGFIIGDDYLTQRDRLLEALETKGPGTLVHPWYGEMTVALKDPARVGHTSQDGGMCTITMSFYEDGGLAFPTAANSNGAQTLAAADSLQGVAIDDFASRFKIEGQPAFVLDEALKVYGQNLELIENGLSSMSGLMANPLDTLFSNASSLLPDSYGTANAVFGMFSRTTSVVQLLGNLFGLAGASTRNRDAVQSLTGLSSAFNARASVPVPSGVSPTRSRVAQNAAALNDLFSNAMLVQAAGMTAVMDLPVYDDAVVIRKDVTAALDTQSLTANDDVYRATQDLRTKVHRDISARLINAARMTTVEPRSGMPALVLAYEQYGDVGREAEIVNLNGISRPGFLARDPIKVLSA